MGCKGGGPSPRALSLVLAQIRKLTAFKSFLRFPPGKMLQSMALRLALPGTAQAASCPWTHRWEWQGVFHVHEGGNLSRGAQRRRTATQIRV